MAVNHNPDKRPCCRLLASVSHELKTLQDANACHDVLQTLCENCVLLKVAGKSRVKVSQQEGETAECYLAVNPESAQESIDEITKTMTAAQLAENYSLLAKINHLIANNPKLKQIADKLTSLIVSLREGEKKFGRVPDTKIIKDENKSLDSKDLLQQHPLLSSPQFDGANPKSTADPVQNPKAAEEANRLQLQHAPKPGFNPRPQRNPG